VRAEEKNSELNFPEGGGGPGGGGGGAMPKTSSVKHQLLDWCKQVLVPQGIEDITNFQQWCVFPPISINSGFKTKILMFEIIIEINNCI
jgi:hypothetical protein